MIEVGSKVKLNDQGMEIVRENVDAGLCNDPIPEELVGVVVSMDMWIEVKLPVAWNDYGTHYDYSWPFTADELISIKQ